MTDYVERPSAHEMFACVWSRTIERGGVTSVVPDACADVMWHRESGRLFVAGPDTSAYQSAPSPGLLLAVRFRPGLAPAGLGVPTAAVRDQRVDLDQLWPAARVRKLADDLNGAWSVEAASRVLADTVASVGAPWDPAAPTVMSLVRGGERMASIATTLGWTERQLHRRSSAAFGYGPKVLQRVLRFDRAMRLARGGVELATVAAEAGYADQAHMAREVRALAGAPMTTLL
jgi:AraC-like DNA-binding protein